MTSLIGQLIGHYQIIEKLGEGGMGVVYKARDMHLDRFVAVKVLPPEKVADPVRKARFVQEAKAASALNHPNIVVVHDISSDGGVDFIAMECVAGRTLDQLIGRKGLSLNEALKHLIQIADALARAHAAGIVHRDLKPSNVMVDEHGLVKVLDFGLAKLTENPPAGEDASTQTIRATTDEGTIVGTAAYMSPEQAEGKKVDARGDIFSFGAVLYEMVTGRRAFQGDSKMSTLSAVLHQEPKPLENVPHDLEKIISRCLRKDPGRRFQHVEDLKVELQELKEELDSQPLETGAAPKPKHRWLLWSVATPVVLVVAAVTAWFVIAGRPASTPVLNPVPLTSFPGYQREPTFSPEGSQVAFSWNGENQDNYDIYVMLVGGGKPLRLTMDPAEDFSPAWSPDGRNIAFLRRIHGGKAAVMLVPPLGGPERKLGEVCAPSPYMTAPYLAWSPAGDSLAVVDKAAPSEPAGLFLLLAETGEKRRLTSPPPGTSQGDSGPAFSPDGDSLVFSRIVGSGVSDLRLLALGQAGRAPGEPRRLTFGNWNVANPAWTSRFEVVFSSSGRSRDGLWRIATSGKAEPAKLPFAAEGVRTLAISARSHRLVFSRSMDDSNIWRVELPNGRISGPFISSTRLDYSPQYSPDGSRIAFTSDRSGTEGIWVSDADGSNAVQLASTGNGPTWSPDGQRIAFHSNHEGRFQVYVVGAGGGKPLPVFDDPAVVSWPSWSRDAKWIYFDSIRSGVFEIWKVAAGLGGAPQQAVQVTHRGGYRPLLSPDGRWLYYAKTYPVSGLWRMPVEGGEETQILEAVAAYSYAVSDGGVYFMKPSGITSVLQFLDLAMRRVKPIATTTKPLSLGLTVSPNHRWALFSQMDQQGSDLMLVENFR